MAWRTGIGDQFFRGETEDDVEVDEAFLSSLGPLLDLDEEENLEAVL